MCEKYALLTQRSVRRALSGASDLEAPTVAHSIPSQQSFYVGVRADLSKFILKLISANTLSATLTLVTTSSSVGKCISQSSQYMSVETPVHAKHTPTTLNNLVITLGGE